MVEPRNDEKPLVVAFAGQSNMLGHAKAIDGGKPENALVKAWNNKGSNGAWATATLGAPPFNTKPGQPNNAALHFADIVQRRTGRTVYLIGCPVNGSTLLSWSSRNAPNMARMVGELNAAFDSRELVDAAARHIDVWLWLQGESDDVGATMVHEPKLADIASYTAGFSDMIQELASHGWWSRTHTRIIAGRMVDDGWLAARNDFYDSPALWPADTLMRVAGSEGLGHVGDRAHYNGEALQEMGRRMSDIWLAWTA